MTPASERQAGEAHGQGDIEDSTLPKKWAVDVIADFATNSVSAIYPSTPSKQFTTKNTHVWYTSFEATQDAESRFAPASLRISPCAGVSFFLTG